MFAPSDGLLVLRKIRFLNPIIECILKGNEFHLLQNFYSGGNTLHLLVFGVL